LKPENVLLSGVVTSSSLPQVIFLLIFYCIFFVLWIWVWMWKVNQ